MDVVSKIGEMDLMVYQNFIFGAIRMVGLDGVPFAVASDVARALEYSNPSKAIQDHCKGVTKRYIPTNGGMQEMNLISEGDILRLIVRSRLPEAQRFEKWIFEEVLPSIRKHGAYITPPKLEEILLNPDLIIGLATKLKEEQERNLSLATALQEVRPKAALYEHIAETKESVSMAEAAKLLNYAGVGQNNLFKILRGRGVFKSGTYEPKQEHMDKQRFEYKAYSFTKCGRDRIGRKVYVTPKGIGWIKRILDEEGYIPNIRKGA